MTDFTRVTVPAEVNPEASTAVATPAGQLGTVLRLVLRASTVHIGGIATAAWLRSRLVETGHVTAGDFNRCFAVARLTPGTNLLAFYAALGYRVAQWRGALSCVSIGTVVPAAVALVLALVYVQHAADPGVDRLMSGARAGALAVLVWTASQLLVSTARGHRTGTGIVAAAAALAFFGGWLPPVGILLTAGAAGALFLRDAP